MNVTTSPTRTSGMAAGLLLIAVGIVALALRAAGTDPFRAIADAGWPLFVILPGLVLLALALVTPRPAGLGFLIAGSIVTSVGLLLWYQDTTGHWESWAYAWALIGPGAAGLALAVHGLATRTRSQLEQGIRMVVIAGVLFGLGFWFFETIFETGRAPLDLATWWPIVVIGVGLVVLLSGVFERRSGRPTEATEEGATR